MNTVPLPLRWDDESHSLWLLDQRKLPFTEVYLEMKTPESVFDAIRAMVLRGAPLIGVVAAYGMALSREPDIEKSATLLKTARPTAVNLAWAVDRMLDAWRTGAPLLPEAKRIHQEDEDICFRIGQALLPFMKDGTGVLTHCNAGQLATTRWGTALSPIHQALLEGVSLRVYADETRPRLQGGQLTAYELAKAGAHVTVLCDDMAACAMAQGLIDLVIVGCDRVAASGDVANKVGTLGVAILAQYYGIPFYVAAPTPTIDWHCPSGRDIPIEHRDPDEVWAPFGTRIMPEGLQPYNPSFDVTPAALITGYATELGLYSCIDHIPSRQVYPGNPGGGSMS